MSEATAKTHLTDVFSKLGVSNRAELVARPIEQATAHLRHFGVTPVGAVDAKRPGNCSPCGCRPKAQSDLSYRCTTILAVRKKRSISMPPELDQKIEAAARESGMSYSGWLASTARKEFIIQSGLTAVSEFERQDGAFTPEELADADHWTAEVLKRAKRSGARRRRSA